MNNDEIFHILEAKELDARALECLAAYRRGKLTMTDMAYYLSTIPGFRRLYDSECRRAYL